MAPAALIEPLGTIGPYKCQPIPILLVGRRSDDIGSPGVGTIQDMASTFDPSGRHDQFDASLRVAEIRLCAKCRRASESALPTCGASKRRGVPPHVKEFRHRQCAVRFIVTDNFEIIPKIGHISSRIHTNSAVAFTRLT